ncbi:efflux RND transporter periplasmic adaptor subunit [Aliikangiella coralliicola]|nr:HlyD family efflux transporter periplasmic adaptor subunit [Aliikangiella coralliicola]
MPTIDSSTMWVSEVTAGDFKRKVRGVGKLVSMIDRRVTSEASGVVEQVLVKPGVIVESETVLVELSNPLLVRNLLRSQSDLKVAEAKLVSLQAKLTDERLQYDFSIRQAQLEYESAQEIENAQRKLVDRNVVGKLDFLKVLQATRVTKSRLKMLKERLPYLNKSHTAQLDSEKAFVEQLKYKVESSQRLVDQLKIRAGLSGVLQDLTVEEGERLEIGSNIARVAKAWPLLAELDVQEVQAKDLTVGLKVEIDTRNGKTMGEIVRVDPRVKAGNVQVDVQINELPKGTRPDQSITAIIEVEHIAQTLYIDRPSSVSTQHQVSLFVLDDRKETAERREVKLGRTSVKLVEVLSGVAAGEKVIVSDVSDFIEHPLIKIN